MKCAFCQKELQPEEVWCDSCGAAQITISKPRVINADISSDTIICVICAEVNPPGLWFCRKCGCDLLHKSQTQSTLRQKQFEIPKGIKILLPDFTAIMLEKNTTDIGRKHFEKVIKDASLLNLISNIHFQIFIENGKYFIKDVGSKNKGSTNGTWLNGKKLNPLTNYEINDGDMINIGDTIEGKFVLS
jgi:hypothetical protein